MAPRPLAALSAVAVLLACAHAGSAPPPAAADAGAERILLVEGGAGRLRISDGGRGGTPVVLLHGLGGDLEAWRPQLVHLRASRRAIAYDQRGHGESDRARDGVYTIDALAADLDAVLRALGVDRAVLVGHSLSGTVITAFAAAHPEKVAALVYADAIGDFAPLGREAVEREVFAERSFGVAERRASFEEVLGPARPETRAAVLAALERQDLPAFAGLRLSAVRFEGKARFATWSGRAVAIEAGGDAYPIRASAALGVPRIELAGVSHWLMMDDPEAFDRLLDAVLPVP